MDFDVEEFKQYLLIDKNALDDAVIQQPSLFYAVSEAYAEAAAERDALKEAMAIVDAKLDRSIRAKHTKATEPKIKNEIQASPAHQQAFTAWLEGKEYADKLGALKDAFKDRSYMLRELGNLHASNYFEQTAVRPTANTDEMVYRKRIARIAAAKEAKLAGAEKGAEDGR